MLVLSNKREVNCHEVSNGILTEQFIKSMLFVMVAVSRSIEGPLQSTGTITLQGRHGNARGEGTQRFQKKCIIREPSPNSMNPGRCL